jgi:two-component system nitrogen regulation response regulator GlnG
MHPSSRILIVDDDPAVTEVLRDYLADAGYATDTVLTGRAALTLIQQRRPDVVLLDIKMPEIDGVEVLRRIHATHPDLPVIMTTANDDLALAQDTLRLGAFDYVAKPFDFDYLKRAVAAACLYRVGG